MRKTDFLKYGESQFNSDSKTSNLNRLSFSAIAFLKNYTCKHIINQNNTFKCI